MVEHPADTLDPALADIEKLGGLGLGGSANWRMLIVAAPPGRELGSHYGALVVRQMPPPQIERDCIGEGVVATVDREVGIDTEPLAGLVSMPAVEDGILEYHHCLLLLVLFDIGNERLECVGAHLREEVADERVDLEFDAHWAAPVRSRDCCQARLFAMVMPTRRVDMRVTRGPSGDAIRRRPVRTEILLSS